MPTGAYNAYNAYRCLHKMRVSASVLCVCGGVSGIRGTMLLQNPARKSAAAAPSGGSSMASPGRAPWAVVSPVAGGDGARTPGWNHARPHPRAAMGAAGLALSKRTRAHAAQAQVPWTVRQQAFALVSVGRVAWLKS